MLIDQAVLDPSCVLVFGLTGGQFLAAQTSADVSDHCGHD
jgi:hypothetical protein